MTILHCPRVSSAWVFGCLLLLHPTQGVVAQEAAAKFDHDIEIGVRPGLLRFAKERFLVKPGSRVRLTLMNTDAMQHNLLICRPGKGVLQRVAVAAAALGAKASEKHFVPDSQDVLHATKAILPGQKDVIEFIAPKAPGAYGYVCTLPGHFFTMRGVMIVGDQLPFVPLQRLRYAVYQGRWRKLPDFEALDPKRYGTLDDGVIDLSPVGESRNYGVVFDGVLRVEKGAEFRFKMRSDDGAQLKIADRMVLDLDGVHPMGGGKTATVRLEAGEHPLRLSYFQGGGGAGLELSYQVGDGSPVLLTRRRESQSGGTLVLPVLDRPVVVRAHVEGAGARSIAVGLPSGVHFIFDAERCLVEKAWVGGFLDVGPDRLGRGGKPCKILGQPFAIGGPAAALLRDGKPLPVRFRGYRLEKGLPHFEFDWGPHRVTWVVEAVAKGIGLAYRIEIPTLENLASVRLDLDGDGVRVVRRGENGGVLRLTLLPKKLNGEK